MTFLAIILKNFTLFSNCNKCFFKISALFFIFFLFSKQFFQLLDDLSTLFFQYCNSFVQLFCIFFQFGSNFFFFTMIFAQLLTIFLNFVFTLSQFFSILIHFFAYSFSLFSNCLKPSQKNWHVRSIFQFSVMSFSKFAELFGFLEA